MEKKASILIVDDDESTCESLTLIFRNKGYETETAATGREGLEKAQGRFFNVALLDIKLPDMKGTELIAPLKELHPDTVMIMVTAYASLGTAIHALNQGASAYITKPLNLDDVLATVREALEKQQLVIENRRLYHEAQRELAERKRAQEALKAEHDFISAVLDTVGTLVVVLDRHGRIVRFNKACERATGYSFQEVKNKHIWDLFLTPDEVEPAKAVFQELRTGQFPDTFENHWIARDGSSILISWSNTALIDDAGVVKYVIATGIDITEHRRAEDALIESEDKFRKISASARDAIIMINDRGNIVFWNDKARKMFGYSAEEILGKELHPLLAPERYHESYRMTFDRFRATGRGEAVGKILELSATRKDGTEFSVELVLSSAKVKGAWHAIGVVRDITDRKKLEEFLTRRSKNLETAHEHLVKKYEALNKLLTELEITKKESKVINDCIADRYGHPYRPSHKHTET